MLDSTIAFFESIRGHAIERRPLKPGNFQTSVHREIPLESVNKPILKPQQPESSGNEDLDELAKKLEQVSYRLGKPASTIKPIPLASEEDFSDFVSVNTTYLIIFYLPLLVQKCQT